MLGRMRFYLEGIRTVPLLVAILVTALFTLAVYVFHWRMSTKVSRLLEDGGWQGPATDFQMTVPARLLTLIKSADLLYDYRFALIFLVFAMALWVAEFLGL